MRARSRGGRNEIAQGERDLGATPPRRSVHTERKMVDLMSAACSNLCPKQLEKNSKSQPSARYRLPGDNHR